MKKYILLLMAAASTMALSAAELEKYQKWGSHNSNTVQVRLNAGYAIGGTTPLPLPAEIRTINKFKPYGGANIGIEASKMFGQGKKRWGISGGIHGFVHGMKTSANVKGYKMAYDETNDDGTRSRIKGYFTGVDDTDVTIWGVTMPLKAVWRANHRWTIEAGPFVQFFHTETFKGSVHDGYLRVNTPTGDKVNMDGDTSFDYDFSDDLRPANWGLAVNFDWKATRHISLYGALDWGMSGIFRHDFDTVAFPMYSIYANFGVAYSIF